MKDIMPLFPYGSGWFSETFVGFVDEWGKMTQYRTLIRLALPKVEAIYSDQLLGMLQEMRPGRRLEKVLIDSETFFDEGQDKNMAILGATQAVNHSMSVADSLAYLWGHAIVENALQSFLEIILSIEPKCYFEKVAEQKMTLAVAQNKDFKSILCEKATNHVTHLKKESILMKCGELHRILKEGSSNHSTQGFRFNNDKLKRIDQRRHGVAHGRNLTLTESSVDDDLEYLFQMFGHFLLLMNKKFNLKMTAYHNLIATLKDRDSKSDIYSDSEPVAQA